MRKLLIFGMSICATAVASENSDVMVLVDSYSQVNEYGQYGKCYVLTNPKFNDDFDLSNKIQFRNHFYEHSSECPCENK